VLRLTRTDIVFLIIAFLVGIGVFHETAHALTALAFGFKVYGFYIGFPFSFVLLSGTNIVVLVSGGVTDMAIYSSMFWLWWKEKYEVSFPRAMAWLLIWAILRLFYAIFEVATGT
jgi:hypothetical protein